MENTVPFDILCGECKGNLKIQEKKSKNKIYTYLWCKKCKKRINADFVKNFLSEKYKEKISCMEITSKYSARIFFKP